MLTSKKPSLDAVTSINEDGSRYFIHPADVKGKFTIGRRVIGVILLAVYVLLPWIKINGFPAVFFDIAERNFHFFGLTFLTEDLWLGFFLFSGLGFGLFYVTALFGRLWCGAACPYTVFLEHIFRRIERMVEGDANARRKLSEAPWTAGKIASQIVKHGLYILAATAIAHVFVSYFVSFSRLYDYMHQSPLNNFKAFSVILFLTGALYFCFSWFREQFCIILCPYGRIQSALTDDDTIVIGYDERRGEPRGKTSDENAGDCINCARCVQVCPTGIDIRNGLQMECIGCAACVDACDSIMDKVKRPRGLVRFDSTHGLAGEKRRLIRPRIFLYTGLMVFGLAVMVFFLSGMRSAKVEINRMGEPFYLTDDVVRNQFKVSFVTKKSEPTEFRITFSGLPDNATAAGLEEKFTVEGHSEATRTLIVQTPKKDYPGGFTLILKAEVSPGDFMIEDSIEFLGPSAYILSEEKEQSPEKEPSPAKP